MLPFTALDLRYDDGRTWTVLRPFVFRGPVSGRFVVPRGFQTDFASIPRVFWRVLPPTGRYGKAAVVHDFLYRTNAVPRWRADGVFLEAMGLLDVPFVVRLSMWLAVRLFGGSAYRAGAASAS